MAEPCSLLLPFYPPIFLSYLLFPLSFLTLCCLTAADYPLCAVRLSLHLQQTRPLFPLLSILFLLCWMFLFWLLLWIRCCPAVIIVSNGPYRRTGCPCYLTLAYILQIPGICWLPIMHRAAAGPHGAPVSVIRQRWLHQQADLWPSDIWSCVCSEFNCWCLRAAAGWLQTVCCFLSMMLKQLPVCHFLFWCGIVYVYMLVNIPDLIAEKRTKQTNWCYKCSE